MRYPPPHCRLTTGSIVSEVIDITGQNRNIPFAEFFESTRRSQGMTIAGARKWAEEEFGRAQLGDIRRTRRLVKVADGAAKRPSGKVSKVFTEVRAREGAYDLLENEHVQTKAVADAMFLATAARAKDAGTYAYVAVDGSSLNLTDTMETKGFGRVGSDERNARGLKVMNALCIDSAGVPLGLIEQQYWARPPSPTAGRTKKEKVKARLKVPFAEKESHRFLDAAKNAVARLATLGTRAWIVIDREGDNRGILQGLSELPCHMTVRASWDRVIADTEDDRETLRAYVGSQAILGTYEVAIARTGQRRARTAQMTVRAATVELRLRDKQRKTETRLPMQVVWVRETDASARAANTDALDWLLYTNASVHSCDEALAVVQGYAFRWRIEEFHRTWKSGACNVEDSQLRSFEAMTTWATILAANAVRIERLKYLSRKAPNAPATLELRPIEIEALTHLRRSEGRKTPDGAVSIANATRWIAEIGGWISTNGNPGALTIARGLLRLIDVAHGFELALRMRK